MRPPGGLHAATDPATTAARPFDTGPRRPVPRPRRRPLARRAGATAPARRRLRAWHQGPAARRPAAVGHRRFPRARPRRCRRHLGPCEVGRAPVGTRAPAPRAGPPAPRPHGPATPRDAMGSKPRATRPRAGRRAGRGRAGRRCAIAPGPHGTPPGTATQWPGRGAGRPRPVWRMCIAPRCPRRTLRPCPLKHGTGVIHVATQHDEEAFVPSIGRVESQARPGALKERTHEKTLRRG